MKQEIAEEDIIKGDEVLIPITNKTLDKTCTIIVIIVTDTDNGEVGVKKTTKEATPYIIGMKKHRIKQTNKEILTG